ncbi:MAG: hypothetical protein R3A51_05620 [Nannocystaceae bacterium]|nr:hypothetical protein [Myxococcales bacterium]
MDSEAPTRRLLRAVLLTLAGGLTLAAVTLGPPWFARRSRAQAEAQTLEAAAALEAAFERCVVGGDAPVELGRHLTDRLLTDRGFQRGYVECLRARAGEREALLERLEVRDGEAALLERLRGAAASEPAPYNPGLPDMCWELLRSRDLRAKVAVALGRAIEATPEPRCPGYDAFLGALSPRPLAPPEGARTSGWETARAPGPLVVSRLDSSDGPAGLVAIAPDGARTSIEPPPQLERGLLRWGPTGPVGVASPDATRLGRGEQPRRLEVWTASDEGGAFRPRPLPRALGMPVELWLGAERWYLASLRDDRRDPTALGLAYSDDGGERFVSVPLTTPALPGPRRFEVWGHLEGRALLLLALRKTHGQDDADEAMRALAPTIQLAVARVDAAGAVAAGELTFEHDAPRGWGEALRPCPTPDGALAVIDGELVIAVTGVAITRVHTFAGERRLDAEGLVVACHKDQLVLLARRREEPDPGPPLTGIESSGGPLYRHVCSAAGCDEGALVTDWATRWDLRPSDAGVRGLVELHVAPASVVSLVDEPPGGPLEQREILGSFYSPLDAVVWRDVPFVLGAGRARWGWF